MHRNWSNQKANSALKTIQYQDGMELRGRKMTKDCTQSLGIGNIRALNGCAGRLFGGATLHNHKNSANKSNRKHCTGTGAIKRQILLLKQYSIKMEWS